MVVPTFAYCRDGKWYEDLVYQDDPSVRNWFICFSPKEPAELVVKETALRADSAVDILKRRGFGDCVVRLVNGRKDAHKRFFGPPLGVTDREKALECHPAVSWFLIFRKGVPLPTPTGDDSCAEIWPIFPNREGVYFGEKVK